MDLHHSDGYALCRWPDDRTYVCDRHRFEEMACHVVFQVRARSMPNARLLIERDKKDHDQGRLYLQVECDREDTYTCEAGTGRGGKYYLSEHMTEDELVRLCFAVLSAYQEHELREGFEYRGKRVFGPHIKISALMEVADQVAGRESAE